MPEQRNDQQFETRPESSATGNNDWTSSVARDAYWPDERRCGAVPSVSERPRENGLTDRASSVTYLPWLELDGLQLNPAGPVPGADRGREAPQPTNLNAPGRELHCAAALAPELSVNGPTDEAQRRMEAEKHNGREVDGADALSRRPGGCILPEPGTSESEGDNHRPRRDPNGIDRGARPTDESSPSGRPHEGYERPTSGRLERERPTPSDRISNDDRVEHGVRP